MAKSDMSPEQVRKMSDAEIGIALKELRTKGFDLRSQLVTEKVEDTSQFPKIKAGVARLLTERSARAKKSK
ncbi:MAG: 50S ribosomal protein L29 [Phycisphaerales bacterium]|jgi:ribosomal protein L29|nr:50S ribosomal protein L29 [Phycisphaerales bacterium]NUQ66877.1 50S ribosomal protein L29 [Phycisphaerales bacterium]